MEKRASPDIKDEIIKRMNDLILNNKGDISYKQGLPYAKLGRERIIEDVDHFKLHLYFKLKRTSDLLELKTFKFQN